MAINIKNLLRNLLILILFIFATYYIFSCLACEMFVLDFWNIPINKKNIIKLFVSTSISLLIFTSLRYSLNYKNTFSHKFAFLKNDLFFAIFLFTLTIIFSFLIPVLRIPDEPTHINQILNNSGIEYNIFANNGYYHLFYPDFNEFNGGPIDLSKYFCFDVILNTDTSKLMPGIVWIKYLPQAIPLIICAILKAPFIVTAILCELCSTIFYVLLCYISLRVLPFKKLLFKILMTLPICIQQAGSFSYDCPQFALAFLFFALLMNFKFKKNVINGKDILLLVVILAIISLIKIPYILLAFTFFALPINKISIKFFRFKIDAKSIKKNKIKVITISTIICILVILLIFWIIKETIYFKIVTACSINLFRFIWVFINSVVCEVNFLLSSVFIEHASFEVKSPSFLIWYGVCTVFLIHVLSSNWHHKSKSFYTFKNWEKALFVLVGITVIAGIYMSMIEWTAKMYFVQNDPNFIADANCFSGYTIDQVSEWLYKFDTIQGVQGRYFIPLLPLFFLPFNPKYLALKLKNFNHFPYLSVYYLISFGLILRTLSYYYWI